MLLMLFMVVILDLLCNTPKVMKNYDVYSNQALYVSLNTSKP